MVEIRATDRAGLLAVLTAVFERAGVDIAWAKVTTLGSSVVDAFCIVGAGPAEWVRRGRRWPRGPAGSRQGDTGTRLSKVPPASRAAGYKPVRSGQIGLPRV